MAATGGDDGLAAVHDLATMKVWDIRSGKKVSCSRISRESTHNVPLGRGGANCTELTPCLFQCSHVSVSYRTLTHDGFSGLRGDRRESLTLVYAPRR
ncbi:hypothetical protein CYMTET_29201 [Cymbomonas tetramitiformis]|uniref:Uncharacterized protein n=1 Tax=Cymbomonas tetramitiformis TaxID=36881 RepID=A0AAE0KVF5_9CHLO|nr:hypothetical protein CYMTET_29201 [Cymbomonas tetramitiformis]